MPIQRVGGGFLHTLAPLGRSHCDDHRRQCALLLADKAQRSLWKKTRVSALIDCGDPAQSRNRYPLKSPAPPTRRDASWPSIRLKPRVSLADTPTLTNPQATDPQCHRPVCWDWSAALQPAIVFPSHSAAAIASIDWLAAKIFPCPRTSIRPPMRFPVHLATSSPLSFPFRHPAPLQP